MEIGAWLSLARKLLWIRGVARGLFLGLLFQTVVCGNRIQMTSSSKPMHHVTSGVTPICPTGCFCNALSRIVYCSRRGLVEIPGGVPVDSLQLNMNGNHFRVPFLRRSNFSDLPHLEHLYLSECGIEGIDFGTFLDLPRLKWLDLSNNRLKTLTPRSFQGLDLLHLFLNGNRNLGLNVDSFDGLVTVGLYLHDCSLAWLQPEVLAPLSTSLKYLWLNGNELTTLDIRLEEMFRMVAHLRLSSNPLHCNCRLSWLKTLYDSNGDIFKGAVAPSCLGPQRLKGKFLNEVSESEFRCQAPAFRNIDAIFGLGDGRLDCRASGDPAPDLYWIRPSGRTIRYAAKERQDLRTNEATLWINRTDPEHHLFGMYICVATNEAGNVTLTINVSRSAYHDDGTTSTTAAAATTTTTTADLSSTRTTSRAVFSELLLRKQITTTRSDPRDSVGMETTSPELSQEDKLLTTRPNYTLIRSQGTGHQETRMFSVMQMVFAVVGSHVCTLVLCLLTVPFCYRNRWTRLKPRPASMDEAKACCREKFPAPEAPVPESPTINSTGCSQFYLPDYFIKSPQRSQQ